MNINNTVEGFLERAIEASYAILEPDGRAIRDKIRRARTEIRERGANPRVRSLTSNEKNLANHETDIGVLKRRMNAQTTRLSLLEDKMRRIGKSFA